MILEVQHETRLDYTEPVSEWMTELRMQPMSDDHQSCHSFHLQISQPTPVFSYLDGFGNHVHHFNLLAPHQQVRVLAACIVETTAGGDDLATSEATFPLDSEPGGCSVLDFLAFRGPVCKSAHLQQILDELSPGEGQRVGQWVMRVGDYLRSRFQYARHVTDSSSPIDHILATGKGVCQDFAHLMIAILRSYRVPVRYVSGYIHRPNKESQSHAWCEVWLPDRNWVGFDPTNGCQVNDTFVRVATGRDFTDVPPNKGTHRGAADETISVRVATRQLTRLPSFSWHERLEPLDVPLTALLHSLPIEETDEQMQQQQQQQQQ